MAEHDFLTWFAGFFDGEGHIQIRKSGKHGLCVRMTVSQVEGNNGEAVCREIQSHFGGHVVGDQPRMRDGHIRQYRWTWDLTNRFDIKEVLESVMPYFRVKTTQAERAMALIADITDVRMAHWTEEEIAYIKENYLIMEYSQIAKTLRRGIKTTRNFIHTLGLPNKRGRVA